MSIRFEAPKFDIIVHPLPGIWPTGQGFGLNEIQIEQPEALILATKLVEELRKIMPVEDLLKEIGLV